MTSATKRRPLLASSLANTPTFSLTSETHARALTAKTRSERIDVISEIMLAEWFARPHRRALAALWGVTDSAIRGYSADASRRCKLTPEVIMQKRIEYIEAQERIADEARGAGDYRAASGAITAAAELVGAKAAARHEVQAAAGAGGEGGGAVVFVVAARPALGGAAEATGVTVRALDEHERAAAASDPNWRPAK